MNNNGMRKKLMNESADWVNERSMAKAGWGEGTVRGKG
jgi:hypothetical protein